MFKKLETLLFATNLSETCIPAFELAVSMATRYQATLVILHVFEKVPDYVTGHLKALLGEKQWGELLDNQADKAHKSLLGKRSSNALVKEALKQFCGNTGIDDDSCGYFSREVVVTDGEIDEEIINEAKNYKADLIVLGSRRGFLHDNRIGYTVKSVMQNSRIPVLVVPPYEQAAKP